MSYNKHYDTVAFDVRENASMLFFARTTAEGDIEDYLLLMRPADDAFGGSIYLEVNENEASGHDLIGQARLAGNILTLDLTRSIKELGGATQIVISYDDSEENRSSVEMGAFRVLGNTMTGGNA